jgi:probable rRNA maturation factor
MNFFLADILISKDEDVHLNIKKQILIKGLDLINKELKTSKTNNSCLTVSLRFINIRNMKKLNYSFSGSNKETNVLSFLPDPNETDENNNSVGDIAICVDVLKKEAKEQNKDFLDHLLHLFVHGILHLLGYKHDSDREASKMEQIEKSILSKLGIEDPYLIEL